MIRKVAIAWALILLGGPAAWGVTLEWTRQLGTSSNDVSWGVSADSLGNVYITGLTGGSLGGTSAGGDDAFVAKYNAAGALQWTRQLGSRGNDLAEGVSADGLGNVYISGTTTDSLGGTGDGDDAFVSKYSAAGALQWTRQWGAGSFERGSGVSADGLGNVYVSGWTSGNLDGTNAGLFDAFVRKYDAAGALQWTRQLGTSGYEFGEGVSADALGNVYISGSTSGSLDGPNAGAYDAFVTKYDAVGNLQWTRQLGSSAYDSSRDVSADGLGNVYISGYTFGSLDGTNTGDDDAFVTKYDAAGNLQWTRQLGTSGADYAFGSSADGLGNVYISGFTDGILGGTSAGDKDAFISKYNAAGILQWTRQLGTSVYDFGDGVSADGLGNFYLSGYTAGSLGGANAGGDDAFVAKFSDAVPEQSTLALASLALIPLSRRRTVVRKRN